MGKAIWGTSGGFQGKNGANVGRWLDGQNIVGPLPHPSQNPPTTGQINQRAKFALVTGWLRLVKGIIRTGYNVRRKKVTAWSTAVQYNLDNAVTGVAPNYEMNYPYVKFCKGELTVPMEATVTSLADAELKFDWSPEFNVDFGADTDKATMVVYNPDKGLFTLRIGAATRIAGTYTLHLPASFSGDEVQCYMSFLSADGEVSSDSVFVAAILVV